MTQRGRATWIVDKEPIRTHTNSENHKHADDDTDVVAFLLVVEGGG